MHFYYYIIFGLLVLPSLAAPPDHDPALNTDNSSLPIGPLDPPDDLATDMNNVNSGNDPALNSDYRTLPIDSLDPPDDLPNGM